MGDLSKNFSREEFACKCGCGFADPHPALVEDLQDLRENLGIPIHITSGCRCPKHNREVGGRPNSYHLNGMAADIDVKFGDELSLSSSYGENNSSIDLDMWHEHDGFDLMYHIFYNVKCVIAYDEFTHLDVRGFAYTKDNRTEKT